MGKKADALP